MTENEIREKIALHGKSLFERGYTSGSSGNISVKLKDSSILVTPTNSCLGRLDPHGISKIDSKGLHLSGEKPSKEWPLHLAVYSTRPEAGAVIHLHSSFATALSCLEHDKTDNVLPPVTPYFIMKTGTLPLVQYFPPGSINLAGAVSQQMKNSSAVLLAHHGFVLAGKDIDTAVYASEELEETAKIYFLVKNSSFRLLTEKQVLELKDMG